MRAFRLAPVSLLMVALVALVGINAVAQTSNPPVSSSTSRKSAQSKPKVQAPATATTPSSSSGQTVVSSQTGPRSQAGAHPDVKATDAERDAITFTGYDLDVLLTPRARAIAVRAVLNVRNDGQQPLTHVALQLSYGLNWESIHIGGKDVPFGLQTVNSDADHTGQLQEAVVVLPQPLAPGASLLLDTTYRGTIDLTGKRLEAIGTPTPVAQHSDWDRISPAFTGLRGFGGAVWYPVSSVPVALGDGARFFTEIGRQKLRQSAAIVTVRLSIDYMGAAPNLAVLDGHIVAVTAPPASATTQDVPMIATCSLPPTPLGFATPSLFVAARAVQTGKKIVIFPRPEDVSYVQSYFTASTMVSPMLEEWFGPKQKQPLTIVDLPEPQDAPYEAGTVLFTAVREAAPEQLTSVLSHAMTHSYFQSQREWLNEGVAHFMGTLWIERESGRDTALQSLEGSRRALSIAEPASPTAGTGQPLPSALDPIYYRTKAAYVFWMLRDTVGDGTLGAALRAYDPAADTNTIYFQKLLEGATSATSSSSTATATYAGAKDLRWFFDDWVYRDVGLPDLSIDGVYPSKSAAAHTFLVAVSVKNEGYAPVDVPVTVRSDTTTVTERVRVQGQGSASRRILVQGTPVEVILNDGSVPEVQTSSHARSLKFAADAK